MARLRIVSGDGSEQVVHLGEARLRIGRGRDNDVVLPDPQQGVSRAHAELRFENGHYVIVDLQSQNGTWINGRRVERSEVPFGAEVAIGAYRLSVLSARPTPVARATPPAQPADPLDDFRATEHFDAPIGRATPVTASRHWMIGAALVVVLTVGLAAVVWVSGGRQGPETVAADGSAAVPAAARPAPPVPAERSAPSDGGSEPLDVAADSPTKRAVERPPTETPRAADGSRVGRRPGESNEAWRSRAAALQMRYGYSKAALDRGDFAAAAGGFEAILLEEPGFLDAPRLLVQAQAGVRASARSLYQAGRKLDDAGDWVGALQKYEQARQIYSGVPELSHSLQRVRVKLRTAGTAAFNEGREHESKGRPEDALKAYEQALQWLPAEDPNWQVARVKVQQLKRKQ